ncbi:MAG: hypothetical protein K0R99_709 [Microbacterium sp.]|nr:hypothetical protein [Microbacterium sp.]
MPAVPEGSPSSDDRAWSPSRPVTIAVQLWFASQARLRMPEITVSACSTEETGSMRVRKRDLRMTVSCSTAAAMVAG